MLKRNTIEIKIILVRFCSSSTGRTAKHSSGWIEALINEIIDNVKRGQAFDSNSANNTILARIS